MARKGTIKFINPRCGGYGFVIDDEDGQEYFFGQGDTTEYVMAGDKVMFDLIQGRKGLKATTLVKLEKYGQD
jgi:cold shock CspA family protein